MLSRCIFMTLLLVGAVNAEQPNVKAEHSTKKNAIHIHGAQVMVPLAGINDAPVYLQLINKADHDISLLSVTAAYAVEVSLIAPAQATVSTSFIIPAKGQLQLKKGAPYLLLKGLKAKLRTGDELQLILRFSDKSQATVTARAISQYDQPHH